jgi:hypothetical protein
MNFSRSFVFPVASLLQRPIKDDGPRARAVVDTTTTIPAFIRMQYNGRFAFLGVGNINIYLADFHTMVTSVADILIKDYRIIRCGNIRNGDCFFLRHILLQ